MVKYFQIFINNFINLKNIQLSSLARLDSKGNNNNLTKLKLKNLRTHIAPDFSF